MTDENVIAANSSLEATSAASELRAHTSDAPAPITPDLVAASPTDIGTGEPVPDKAATEQPASSEQIKAEQPQTRVSTSKSATIGIELAAMHCIVEYGGAEGVRAQLTERAKKDPKFTEILEYFDAWDAGKLPQYLEQRCPKSAVTPPVIKIVSDYPMESTNAHPAH